MFEWHKVRPTLSSPAGRVWRVTVAVRHRRRRGAIDINDPVSALLLGMTFLDERPDPNHFIGMALIGVGLAAIDGRPENAQGTIAARGSNSQR